MTLMNKIFSDKSNAECVSSLDPPINIVIGTAEDFTMEKSSEDSPSEDVQSEEEVNDKEHNDFKKCLNDIANPLRIFFCTYQYDHNVQRIWLNCK